MVRQDRRRQVLVDRKFQLRATAIGVVYIVAVALFLFLPLVETLKSLEVLAHTQSENLALFYKKQQTYTIASVALFITGLLGAWTVFTLWRTHKIAGPVVKITRYVHQFATGNFEGRIQLREGDELQALARAMNDMAASLQERDNAIRNEILAQIEAVKRSLYDAPHADTAISDVQQLVDGINRSFEARWDPPVPEETPSGEPVAS